MRNAVLWLVLAVVLAVVNLSIAGKEKTLREGQTMLLQLAPVDPRSLLQGDYMVLRYAIAGEAFAAAEQSGRNGQLVVVLDSNSVATFKRIDDNSPLADNEMRLLYRVRGSTLRLASDAYFFQEGTAERYSAARYGELKVDTDGGAVLVGLRDAAFESPGE
ncbi:MAG: GDYXXLXY domain-containing protein [Gammaproteobacteria bacterium]|nr:GDYXXLXY domain-containing protein [Gammaproteobacteria bacterium]